MNCEKEVYEEPMETDTKDEKMEVTIDNEDSLTEEAIALAGELNKKLKSLNLKNAHLFMQNFERNVILLPKEENLVEVSHMSARNSDDSEYEFVNKSPSDDAASTTLKESPNFEMEKSISSIPIPDSDENRSLADSQIQDCQGFKSFTVETTVEGHSCESSFDNPDAPKLCNVSVELEKNVQTQLWNNQSQNGNSEQERVPVSTYPIEENSKLKSDETTFPSKQDPSGQSDVFKNTTKLQTSDNPIIPKNYQVATNPMGDTRSHCEMIMEKVGYYNLGQQTSHNLSKDKEKKIDNVVNCFRSYTNSSENRRPSYSEALKGHPLSTSYQMGSSPSAPLKTDEWQKELPYPRLGFENQNRLSEYSYQQNNDREVGQRQTTPSNSQNHSSRRAEFRSTQCQDAWKKTDEFMRQSKFNKEKMSSESSEHRNNDREVCQGQIPPSWPSESRNAESKDARRHRDEFTNQPEPDKQRMPSESRRRSKSSHSTHRNHENQKTAESNAPQGNHYSRNDNYAVTPLNQISQNAKISKPPPKPLSLQAVQTQVANVTENDWLQGTKTLQQCSNNRNKKSINILVLGQTGVGKSTWINAFANYLFYATLDDAINAKAPICVVPTKFSMYDDHNQRHEVLLGNHSNEVFSSEGQSATQSAKTYVLQKDDLDIYLIDTPGMDDTRGPQQDEENVQKILRTIAPFKEIHAICFFFKANDARLNQSFRYCIGKLLANLSKSALSNICFVFTNARGTFYKPGDTMAPLKSYFKKLEEKEKLSVKINDDNIFCLDNEAFRFICAYFSQIKFSKGETKTYGDSWKHSSNEVKRLLLHASRIQPHKTSETLSINDTKTWITQLINPIIDISGIVQTNMQQQYDRIRELETMENSIEALQHRLNIPITSLKIERLDKPQTVCVSKDCIGYENIMGTMHQVFKTVCHENCNITGAFSDRLSDVPDPASEKCEVFIFNKCSKCHCHFKEHRRIFFTQRVVTNHTELQALKSCLTSQTDASKLKQKMIRQSEKMIAGCRHEFEYLISAMAKFSLFLFQNGIAQKYDIFEKHIENAIEREEKILKSIPYCDDRKYCQLGDLLMSYRQMRNQIFNDKSCNRPSLTDIQEVRQRLFALPLTGSKIMEIFDIHVEADHHDYAHGVTVIETNSLMRKAATFLSTKFSNATNAVLGFLSKK